MGGDDDEKRSRVKLEILTTERSYVADLSTAIDVFMRPLLAIADDAMQSVASRDEIVTIFSNLESILYFNQQLLVALEEEQANGQSSIGQIFIEMAPYLRMYCIYVNNHSRAVEMHSDLVNRISKKDGISRYQNFLNECAEKQPDRVKNRQLTDLLIMPVQRVPRYRLLLEELLKRTPPGDEYDTLEMGLAKIADAANLVNERLREFENRMMVLRIQARLGNAIALVQPHRMFVLEGTLQKMCRKGPRDYVFILLSDLLVYGVGSNSTAAEHDFEQTITFKRQIDLSTASLASDGNVSFKISSPTKSFVVLAKDDSTKATWFNAIQNCISTCTARMAELNDPNSNSSPTSKTSSAQATVTLGDEFAPVWVPDKDAPACQLPECGVKFTLLTRRHHCRMCGLVVCAECSPHRWHLPNIDKARPQRICHQCYLEIRSKLEEDNFASAGSPNAPRPAAPPPPRSNSTTASSFFQLRPPSGLFSRLLKTSSSMGLTGTAAAASASPAAKPSTTGIAGGTSRPSPASAFNDSSPSYSSSTYANDTKNKPIATETPSAARQQQQQEMSTPVNSAAARSSAPAAAAASSEGLPKNWVALKDEHGTTYYWHVVTDKVQYDKPTGKVTGFNPVSREGESDAGISTRASQSGGGGLYSWSRSSKSNAATTSSPPNPSSNNKTTVAVSKSSSPPKVAVPSNSKPPIGSITQVKGSGSPPSTTKAKLPFVNTTSVDKRTTGNALPPGSPLNASNRPPSPRSSQTQQQQVPVNAASLLATKERRKSMVMGPSLGERLASLNEQGVFGDPHLSRFGGKPSSSASSFRKSGMNNTTSNHASSITSSPLLSPRQASSNGGFSSKPSGNNNNNSRPMSSVAGSTFNYQASSGSNARPQSSTLSAVATYERKAQSAGSQTGSTGYGSPITNNINKQLSVSTGASPLSMPRKPSPTNNASSQRSGTSSQRFGGGNSNASTSNKIRLSTLSDVEFYRVMGVFRNEFNQYGAKRKEELMQAKNVC